MAASCVLNNALQSRKADIERVSFMTQEIKPLTGVPVRFFVWDEEAGEDGSGEIVECTEEQFIASSGKVVHYDRHTVFANGVNQICLTKTPAF